MLFQEISFLVGRNAACNGTACRKIPALPGTCLDTFSPWDGRLRPEFVCVYGEQRDGELRSHTIAHETKLMNYKSEGTVSGKNQQEYIGRGNA